MATTHVLPNGADQPHDLQTERTKDSADIEKDIRMETESINSALGGNDIDKDSNDDHRGDDLEKATTQASHGSHGSPATRIVTAVDWTGPDDNENPMIWPLWQKGYQTLAIGTLAFAVTAGSSLITPSVPEIAEHFQVSRTAAILSLTLYVLGLAFGPVLAAPISETYGRSIVYVSLID